jgi:hypothetical protein
MSITRDAGEVLHRVVEDAVGAAPVVEHRDGVGVRELAHVLHLALEPIEVLGADLVGQEELDRGRAAQQRVARAVHRAVAALADLAIERVLAELHRLADLPAQAVDDARAGGREHDRDRAEHHAPQDERRPGELLLTRRAEPDRGGEHRDPGADRDDRGAPAARRHDQRAREHGERAVDERGVRGRPQLLGQRRARAERDPDEHGVDEIDPVERPDRERAPHEQAAPEERHHRELGARAPEDQIVVARRERVDGVHHGQERHQRHDRGEHQLREQGQPRLQVGARLLVVRPGPARRAQGAHPPEPGNVRHLPERTRLAPGRGKRAQPRE